MTGIIYRAYHQAKGEAFTYIRDVREAAELPDEQFDQLLDELAGAGTVELLQGFEGWDTEGNGAGSYTDTEGDSFLGLSWVKSPDAFECLWAYREEIAEIMGNHPKKEAVSLIAAMPGLNHLKTNTINSNITPIPFLLGEFRGKFLGYSEEKEGDALRTEIESIKAELERERVLGEKYLGNSGKKEKEVESLKAEAANLKAESERGKVLGNLGEKSLGEKQNSGDDVRAEMKALKAEIAEIRQMISSGGMPAASGENKNRSIAGSGKNRGKPPTNFMGWTVALKTKASGVYYEMVRKIDGKFRFLYIGKKWDEAKALRKIQGFDAKQTL